MRAALLASIVAVAMIRAASTWPVFAATADEPQHIAAGVEWLARADRVQHEPWRTVNPPLARIAVGVGPYLAGLRTTPVLVDLLYSGPGYARNLALARAGVLPFLALVIILTWLLARRAYGEAPAWIAALVVASIPAVIGHAGLATTDVAYTACFLLALLLLLRWIEQPDTRRAAAAGLALGLAAATKFSAVSLPVVALLAIAARRGLGPRPGTGRRLAAQAPLVGLLALLVIWGSTASRSPRRRRSGNPRGWKTPSTPVPVASRPQCRALAGRASHAGTDGVSGGAGSVRPGSAGALDRVPAGSTQSGRLPGVLPGRARGQDAATADRARVDRVRRPGARSRAGR